MSEEKQLDQDNKRIEMMLIANTAIEAVNIEQGAELEAKSKRIKALTNAGNDLIDSAGGSPKQQFRLSAVRWDNLLSNTKGDV